MRRFVRTDVPIDGYKEITRVGDRWLVRLEGEPSGNAEGTVACWECMTDDEPDLDGLAVELAEWKEHLAERELEAAKSAKIAELMAYDASEAVNGFVILQGGVKLTDYWLPRDLRISLESDVKDCAESSDTYDFDIREMGVSLPLDCGKFLTALKALKKYAVACYNNTSRHIAAIQSLGNRRDVEGYDFTVGYPPKLSFDVVELM